MLVTNRNGLTVKELKDFIKDWPEKDEYGDPFTVWVSTEWGLSNLAKVVVQLNDHDLLLETYL